MFWRSVLDNVERQRGAAAATAAKTQKAEIEAFYPELHSKERGGLFTNTSGSLLIPELLTSPCVVVDLYDTPEEELVLRYRVDKKFLLTLRDLDRVVLSANADYERYEKHPWMHEILSDPRTIFRSVRTPQYFEALFPGIQEERERLQRSLVSRFEAMTRAEFSAFVSHYPVHRRACERPSACGPSVMGVATS